MTQSRAVGHRLGPVATAILLLALAAALVGVAPLSPARAESASQREAEKLVADAQASFAALMADEKKAVPAAILKKARAVAIFPRVAKGGFLVGAKTGTGVLLVKRGRGWSGPAFYNLGGMTFGALVGVQAIDLVMVVMTAKGLQPFLRQEFTIGPDASAVAGTTGARDARDIDVPKGDLLTYSRVEGLFAGLSIDGAKILYMDKVTGAYYGEAVSAKGVLMDGAAKAPPSADGLKRILDKSMAAQAPGADRAARTAEGTAETTGAGPDARPGG